jgi:hypothetical protein
MKILTIISNAPSEFRILIYAGLVLFLSSLMMQYPFHSAEFNLINDAESYKIAMNWLYAPDHFASYTRPFLFSLLIGLPRLFGFEYHASFVVVVNLIFWFFTVLLLFRVNKDISDEKTAFKMALVFVSCVSLHCFMFSVHTEIVYAFIVFSHVYCLYQYLKTGKNNWLYGAIWLLGASVGIRPTLAPIVFVLLFVFAILVIFKKMRFKKFTVICLLLFSTVGLQIFNMYRCSHRFKISYIGDTAWYLLMGAYATNIGQYPNQTIDFYAHQLEKEVKIRLKTYFSIGQSRSRNDVEKLASVDSLVKADMIRQLKENKWGLTFTFFRSLFVNSRSGTQYALVAKNGFNLPYFATIQQLFLRVSQCQNIINSSLVLLILPIVFLKRYIKQRNLLDKTTFLAFYSWFLSFSIMLLSTISFTQGDRFHVVTVPLTLFSVGLLFFKRNTSYAINQK